MNIAKFIFITIMVMGFAYIMTLPFGDNWFTHEYKHPDYKQLPANVAYKETGHNLAGDTLYVVYLTNGQRIHIPEQQYQELSLIEKIGDDLYRNPDGSYLGEVTNSPPMEK